jgi:threonylcarbamoyladenosine tRNA methylthiotransferase MtaB
MTSFSIQNFGCRVNQAEAFDWTAEFQRHGWAFEPDADKSGVVVLNSCTLTSRADRDVRKFVRRIARNNPKARIVVTGCLAERLPAETAALPGVWKVIPNSAKDALPSFVLTGETPGAPAPGRAFRRRAFLKVQDGCDMSCAFCVIPSVRGKSRSVAPEKVRARLTGFADRGFREVVLTGIHLSSYGRDLEPKSSLLDLVREIDAVPGGFRVRLSSLDPRLVTPGLIDHIAAAKRIRPHFHLSLQHGSERVLRAMGRSGSEESYRRILDRFRERSPRAALGADIIVGFPGETDEDFREMREFLEASPLTSVHVFSYSARPGTPSADRPGVDDRTRTERADSLREFAKARNLRFRKGQEGRTEEAVVISRRGDGAAVLTASAIDVRVPRCGAPEGETVMVRILRADDRGTTGEIAAGSGAS